MWTVTYEATDGQGGWERVTLHAVEADDRRDAIEVAREDAETLGLNPVSFKAKRAS